MRDHTPIRARMTSWRIAIATVGVAAMAVTLGQSVSTLANPNEAVSTEGSQIATGNFFPTPLVTNIRCSTKSGFLWQNSTVSWDPPTPAPGLESQTYRYRVDWANGNGEVFRSYETNDTSSGEIQVGVTARTTRIRVHTINPNAPGIVSSGFSSHTVYSSTITYTYCTGDPRYDAPNQPWENTTQWNPALPAPASAGQQTVVMAQRSGLAADVEHVEEDQAEVVAVAGAEVSEETHAPAVNETSEASPSPLSMPSATARPPATSRSTVTTVPSPSATATPSTEAKSTPTPTSIRTPSTSPLAITTMAQAPSTPVRLSGGGEAEITDGTRLVVSSAGAPKCSVLVRKGSTLEVRDGVLEVIDAVETRAVDSESCVLTTI